MSGCQSRVVVGILCALLAGCSGGEAEADWSLALAPRTHANQTPFAGEPTVKLVLRRDSGDEVIELGTARADGTLELDALPPASELADVHTFGLAVEKPGGAADAVDDGRLIAYGEAPATGLAPGAKLDLNVLVSELESIGDLGNLPANQQRFARAVAIVPPGRVFLFAGASVLGSPDSPSDVTADVFVLEDLDGGAPWSFEKKDALEGDKDWPGERLGMSATTVSVDGAPMILLVGGRADLWYLYPNYDDWYLYDPLTGSIADKGKIGLGRSEHQAVVLNDGRVMIVGGWSGTGGLDSDDVELIDPARGNAETIPLDLQADVGISGTTLGTAGALVCGGVRVLGQGESQTGVMSDRCQIINLQGSVRDAAPLPVPLTRHAMTPIGDGLVLVTGGYTESADFDALGSIEATDLAYVYDAAADTWTQVNNLTEARSSHTAIPLSDGRALVIGGVPTDGVFELPVNPDGQSCPELYEPATRSFRKLGDQCGTWGAGAFPATSSWPNVGAVFLKGYTVDEEIQDAVGFVGVGPS